MTYLFLCCCSIGLDSIQGVRLLLLLVRQVHYFYPFGIHVYRPTKGNERDVPRRIACSSTSAMLYAFLAALCIAVRTPLLRQTFGLPRVADAILVFVAFIRGRFIPSRFHFEF